MKTLYLVDGSAYFFRAYYAIRSLSTSKGLPTNAIYGFASMLHKLIREKNPEKLAIIFDSKEATFRKEMYEDYKANRGDMPDDLQEQIPYIKRVVDAFQIPSVQKPTFEADDLIAAVVEQLGNDEDLKIVIVSSDKDLMQLVRKNVVMFDPAHIKGPKTYDIEGVIKKFGVPPEKVKEVLGLMRDSSDNIPGVKGVGPKTATELIKQYGSVQGVIDHIDEISKKALKKNLTEHKEDALLSLKLVTLNTNVGEKYSLKEFSYNGPDSDKVVDLFRELEFSRLLKDFDIKRSEESASASVVGKKEYTSITDIQTLKKWIGKIKKHGRIALDTETDALDPSVAKLIGVSIALGEGENIEAAYIPLRHDKDVVKEQVPFEEGMGLLKSIIEDTYIKKVGQHLKYDYTILKREGITIGGVEDDTMLISYCLNPSSQHNLDAMALTHLDHQNISFQEVAGKGASKKTFNQIPLETATPYAAEDAEVTLRIADHLLVELKENKKLEQLYREIELPLIQVLAEMEIRGCKVNRDQLKKFQKEFGEELEALKKKIYKEAGEEFNINSNKQLQQILFEKLGLPPVKRTKSGYSTDSEVLSVLAPQHPIPNLILQYRELSKLKSTYVDALLQLADENDRVHTSYNQSVAATGRLSSSSPNLQNIPIRTELGKKIRELFITENGWSLVAADYGQIELRILADISGDKKLKEAFQKGIDIHTMTAAQVFGVEPIEVNEEMRRQAKAINFGIIYGISPFGLSKQLEISQKKAKDYIDAYFEKYSGVKKFIENVISDAKKNGFVTTLMGRIRYLPDLHSRNPAVRNFAERTAMNSPIQGTAADFIKIAMLKVADRIEKEKLKAHLILQVHDELIIEAPDDEIEMVKSILQREMESVAKLSVPLEVSIGIGKNWKDAK